MSWVVVPITQLGGGGRRKKEKNTCSSDDCSDRASAWAKLTGRSFILCLSWGPKKRKKEKKGKKKVMSNSPLGVTFCQDTVSSQLTGVRFHRQLRGGFTCSVLGASSVLNISLISTQVDIYRCLCEGGERYFPLPPPPPKVLQKPKEKKKKRIHLAFRCRGSASRKQIVIATIMCFFPSLFRSNHPNLGGKQASNLLKENRCLVS